MLFHRSIRLLSSARAATAAAPSQLLQMPATEVTTLANGLRVASESAHGDVATIAVSIDGTSCFPHLHRRF